MVPMEKYADLLENRSEHQEFALVAVLEEADSNLCHPSSLIPLTSTC